MSKRIKHNYNLLTANVGNPSIAKDILQGVLIDCEHKITTIDALAVLFEAFAEKDNPVAVRDFVDELQDFLFIQTSEAGDARIKYIESVRKGKTYLCPNPYIVG